MKSLFLLIVLCYSLVSCTSTKKVVLKDINNGNIEKLIADDIKYVKYRPYIKSHLISNYDYDTFSYSQLSAYCELSKKDPELYEEYNTILKNRQTIILTELSEMEVSDMAKYYNTHNDEKAFLRKEILEVFATNIEDLHYQEAKSASEAFASTDLAIEIKKSFATYRNKIYPHADWFGEEYEEKVFTLLSNMDIQHVAEYYKTHIRDQMFLTPVLKRVYLTNDTMTYLEIRALNNAFQGTETPLGIYIKKKYDSLRVLIRPFIEQGIDEYLTYEQQIIDTYKSYAYEDAMSYYANASGRVLADFMAPTISDVIDVIYPLCINKN